MRLRVGIVVAVLVVLAVLLVIQASTSTPKKSAQPVAATAIPTNASSVLVPFNQMQGVDWLVLTRTEQNAYVQEAMKTVRCPTGLSVNDVALGVSQAASAPGGRATPALNLLATTLAANGCVAQK